jgi:uncharacterized protein involved in cysteine biosynthesis
MGLLRTIAILIIIYYALKIIGKYIMPLFIKKVVSNVEKKYKQQQEQQQEPNGKVGETVIAKKPPEPKESNKNVGDYVDYEEVTDE